MQQIYNRNSTTDLYINILYQLIFIPFVIYTRYDLYPL